MRTMESDGPTSAHPRSEIADVVSGDVGEAVRETGEDSGWGNDEGGGEDPRRVSPHSAGICSPGRTPSNRGGKGRK